MVLRCHWRRSFRGGASCNQGWEHSHWMNGCIRDRWAPEGCPDLNQTGGLRDLASLSDPHLPASRISSLKSFRKSIVKPLPPNPWKAPKGEAPWHRERAQAQELTVSQIQFYSGLCNSLTGWPLPKMCLADLLCRADTEIKADNM